MKKITLLLILLTVSLGYSQTVLEDFEGPAPTLFEVNGIGSFGVNANQPPGNSLEIITSASGAPWQEVHLLLQGDYIDLTTDKTVSVDIYSDTPTSILGKVSSGLSSATDSATDAFHAGGGWETHVFDFTLPRDGTGPANGIYAEIIFFPMWEGNSDMSPDGSGDGNSPDNANWNVGAVTTTYYDNITAVGSTPPPPPEAIMPIYFDNAYELFTDFGSATSLTADPDDAGNPVMSVTSGGGPFDNAQLVLAQNVDLSDDGDNTITFRINPLNGTGSNSHLLKFEGGAAGPPATELPFTTVGTGWQPITLDFPGGLGNFSTIVLFTDFNNTMQDTYFIDDFAGAKNVELPPDPPSSPAPNPSTDPANVYNIYSEAYPTDFGYTYCFGGIGGSLVDVDLDPTAGENLARRHEFSVDGFGCGQAPNADVSTMTYVSFQYYTDNATNFYIDMISELPGVVESNYYIGTNIAGDFPGEDEAIVTGAWTHVVIPISLFEARGFQPTSFFQFKFATWSVQPSVGLETVFIDNILLTKVPPTLGVGEFSVSEFKVYPNPAQNEWNIRSNDQNITSIEVYDILGKNVMSMKPNAVSTIIDGTALNSGLYFARVSTELGSKSIKLIKQ